MILENVWREGERAKYRRAALKSNLQTAESELRCITSPRAVLYLQMRNVRVTPDSCFVVEELKAADDSAVSQSSFDSSEEGSPGFFKKHTRLFWISQISKFFIQCPLNISDSVCTKGPSDCGQTADTSVCVKAEPCCTLAARSFSLTMKQTQCTDASM